MPDLFVNTFVNASMLLNAPKKPGKRRGRKPKAKKLPMYDTQPPPPATPQMSQLPPQLYNDYVNEYQHQTSYHPPPPHQHYNMGYDDMSGMNKVSLLLPETRADIGEGTTVTQNKIYLELF